MATRQCLSRSIELGKAMTESDLPVLGAALQLPGYEMLIDWIRAADRDVELQDFYEPRVMDGDWRAIVERYRPLLDGHRGRLGIHGPFIGLDLASGDPDVQAVVSRRLLQGLEICEALGANQMVVHSPFNHWHHNNFGNFDWLKGVMFEAVHATLKPVIERAEATGCVLVIENIEDVDPLERLRLVESFNSAAVRISLDTGHAHLSRGMSGAPPVDYFVKAAGGLLHHVHVQDTDGHADRHWLPGDGTISWHAFFEAIAAYTDDPRLVIEVFPDRIAGIPDCVKRLEALGLAR